MNDMNLTWGNCCWIGEDDQGAMDCLESLGFFVTKFGEQEFSSFAPNTLNLCIIRSHCEPNNQYRELLKSSHESGNTILVWTDPSHVDEWQEAGAELVLDQAFDDKFVHLLNFAARIHRDRVKWFESEEKFARSNNDLLASVESLEIASRRFETLFNGLPVGCFTFDAKGMVHEWNGLATEIFGIEGYQAFLNYVWDVLDPYERGAWSPDIVKEIFTSNHAVEFDWSFLRSDGATVHLASKVVGITNKKGEMVAAIAGNLDITARVLFQKQLIEQTKENLNCLRVMEKQRIKLQDANRQLKRLAVTDGLTSLINRRRFNELLEETLDRAIRQAHTFSILMFDIDHFKKLNDVFGHQAGDEILEKFAAILRTCSRRYERPARYGGEEFVIILDGCDKTASLVAAERFRTAINSKNWPYRDITASIGCATFSGTESARELVEHADLALYASKNNGRDQVIHFNDIPKSHEKAA